MEAAALLRRLGFFVFAVLLPSAALFSRRGVVTLFPVGVALVVIAGALDGSFRPLRTSFERLLSSAGILVAVFGIAWAALSLAWSPAPGLSAERLLTPLVTLALGLATYLALPDRMRSANLYLVPIGATLAALIVVASAVVFPADPDEDGRSLERGLSALALLAWPSIAWLRSRGRDAQAIGLVLAIALATLIGPHPTVPAAFALGALTYVFVSLAPQAGVTLARLVLPGLVMLAPALPFLLEPVAAAAGRGGDWTAPLGAWRSLVLENPARLATGHGFGAFLLARIGGFVPSATPDTPLVQIWYDLGLVGALAVAAALWAGLRGAAVSYAPLLPGVVATFICAFALACGGIGTGQAWWPATLAVVALMFVAAERGQFRTRRPPARALGSASLRGIRLRPQR